MNVWYGEGTQLQPNCSSRCTCKNRKWQCEEQTCFADGPTCYAYGDTHFQNFDLLQYSFQGDCEYVLSKSCAGDVFSVVIKNVPKNAHSSRVQEVKILIPGEYIEIVLGTGNGGTATVNGTLQLENGDGQLSMNGEVELVRSGGLLHVLLGKQGIRVFWDGTNRVEVTVAKSWRGKLCGLCGNYNNDDKDDFQGPDGQQLGNANEFVTSWVIGNTSVCEPLPPPFLPCFGPALTSARARCNALMVSPVFTPCNSAVDPDPFIENCIQDYCILCETNKTDCLCNNFAAYASVCAATGILLQNWKDLYCRELNN